MSERADIFPDDIETLEMAGELLFRHHENTAGIRLLAIALRIREQTGIQKYAELTERETNGNPAGSEWPPRPRSVSFACDVDESAGLAEVVDLNGYSRKVVCE